MSVWLLAKSSSIAKTLKVLSQKNEFNAKRELYSDRLTAYKTSILEDGIYSNTLLHSILQEIYTIENKFPTIFSSFRDKKTFVLIKWQLTKKHHNFEKICTYLDYLIARLNIKED